eukprot:1008213-Ditylum_brightwellii.AAC.1
MSAQDQGGKLYGSLHGHITNPNLHMIRCCVLSLFYNSRPLMIREKWKNMLVTSLAHKLTFHA